MKKLLSILLSALMLLSLISITASALTTADGFTYTVADGKATITGYTGTSTDLIIPAEVDGYPVVSIGDSAFAFGNFKGRLVMPEGLTTIGDSAFEASVFKGELVIPESVTTIGARAFKASSFTGELVIPKSVTTIGDGAFWACTGFSGDLIIPGSVTTIGVYAFNYCIGFTGNLIISEGVKTIGERAFEKCCFTGELVIPKSVITIGDYAFSGCSGFAGELIIPEGVKEINSYAFQSCSFIDIYIPMSTETIKKDSLTGIKDIREVHVIYGGTAEQWATLCENNGITELESVTYLHADFDAAEDTDAIVTRPTCSEYGYTTYFCSCGYSYVADYTVPNENHDWHTNDSVAYCIGGTVQYFCNNCDETKSKYIAPTGNHEWKKGNYIAPCSGGTQNYYCRMCETIKSEYVEPTEDHNWMGLNDVGGPLCVGRTEEYVCLYCSATKSEYIAPIVDHSWKTDEFIPVCTGGTVNYYCANDCGTEKTEYVEAEGHLYEYVSDNNATCTEDGTKHEYCSRCEDIGETVVDVGSKLGHDLTETTVLSQQSCTQDGISVQACKRCAEIVATIEGAYGHYDNDGDGKCDECKVVLEVILPEVPSEPETDVTPEEPETPEEPQESNNILAKIMEFFNKIINILKKLFGI